MCKVDFSKWHIQTYTFSQMPQLRLGTIISTGISKWNMDNTKDSYASTSCTRQEFLCQIMPQPYYIWPTTFNTEAQKILVCAEENTVKILTQFVKGNSRVLAGCPSRHNQIISTEWTLHWDISICGNCGVAQHGSFCCKTDVQATELHLNFQFFFFLFSHARKVLIKLQTSQGITLILTTPFRPQREY